MTGLRDWLQHRRIDAVQDRGSHAIGVARSGQHTSQALQRQIDELQLCLLYTSPSPRDGLLSRMPSSA